MSVDQEKIRQKLQFMRTKIKHQEGQKDLRNDINGLKYVINGLKTEVSSSRS